MTPVLLMLRSSMAFLRQAQRALNRGDIAVAFQAFSMARHDLGYAIGMGSGHPSCERVRLCAGAIEARLFAAIRRLAWQPATVDATELVPIVASGIMVLATYGVDVTHEQARERAANVATVIGLEYELQARS